ncbi:MAG: hypothetical protein AAF488_18550 [Planctomycetota bacterium]
MLDVFEKVVWILTALAILAIGGYYLVLGAPSPIPAIAMNGRTTSKAEVSKALGDNQRAKLTEQLKTSPREGDTPKQYERIKEEYRAINRATFERVSNLTDAMHEAKKISSKIVENKDGTNSLQVFDFDENSALGNLGFQENDVIDFIGGEQIDFGNRLQARELFYDLRDRFDENGFIKIDVRRRNRPMKILIKLD